MTITNTQLYNEMVKFQEEISSDEDDSRENGGDSKKIGLIEKLRIKREKEKIRRHEKHKAHLMEIDEYNVMHSIYYLVATIFVQYRCTLSLV